MAGQIIKRGKRTWLIRIYLGCDTRTGKRRYLNKTIHGTRKDAEKWCNDALNRRDMGGLVAQSSMLCEEFFRKWLETKHDVRPKSLETYTYLTEHYIIPGLGGLRVSAVTAPDLQQLYGRLLTQGLGSKSVGYVHTLVKTAFKQGLRWGMIRTNPAEFVDAPRQERREMQALSAAEARRLLEVSDERERVIFATAIATGARPSEYLGLKWSDIDWQAGTLVIQRTLIWPASGGAWYFGEPKTARSRRTISLPPPVLELLREHKRRQAEERLAAGAEWETHGLVFARADGSPLPQWTVRESFKAALERAGLPGTLRVYSMRHGCATILMSEGVNPKIVSERMGHASVALTLGIYSHVLPGMQAEATRRLEEAVFAAAAHIRHTN
jgi:integrase